MTNCLFAQGLAAMTVDMQVRFHRPVVVSQPAMVRAWLTSKRAPIHRLAAELCQAGQIMATATARFVDKQAVAWLEQTRK